MSEIALPLRNLELRSKYVERWIFLSITAPIILDYFFAGSTTARYFRILVVMVIVFLVLIRRNEFLSRELIGAGTIFLTTVLYLAGTVSAVFRGGVITPNFISLLTFMMLVGFNFDLYSIECLYLISKLNDFFKFVSILKMHKNYI